MIDLVSFQSSGFAIPFLFVLALVFGVLELANPMKNRAVNVIVAVAISFFAASYTPFTNMLWNYLPSITWFFIVMFLIVFVLEAFGLRKREKADYFQTMVVQGVVLLLLFTVGYNILQSFNIQIPYIGGGENILFIPCVGSCSSFLDNWIRFVC